jgi:excisionase family DNA binding protein
MSASTFKILKQCRHCGNMFEAQKVSTAYCSHRCNSAHYKLKKKVEKKDKIEAPIFRPRITALNISTIKEKDFLTVREVALLFGCSKQTIYSLINSGRLRATNLNIKKTLVRRSVIDKLFD